MFGLSKLVLILLVALVCRAPGRTEARTEREITFAKDRVLYLENTPSVSSVVSSCHVFEHQYKSLLKTFKHDRDFIYAGWQWLSPAYEAKKGLDAEVYREKFRKICVQQFKGTYIYNYKPHFKA